MRANAQAVEVNSLSSIGYVEVTVAHVSRTPAHELMT
jgi:hypothetical protein